MADLNERDLECESMHPHKNTVEYTVAHLPGDEIIADTADFFKVFADSTRIKILWALHENELCVCDIAEVLGMTKSAVSHQLSSLRRANLVKNRKDGKEVFYTLSDDHVKKIFEMAVEHLEELE